MQRINVGDQVASNPISIYQLHHPRLPNRLFVHLIGAHEEWIAVDVPAQGRVRDAQIREDLFVEFMLAQEQFMDTGEKRAGFRALNDAMIVSAAGQRSEEHTSELQSRPHLVCRLLLEKK